VHVLDNIRAHALYRILYALCNKAVMICATYICSTYITEVID